MGQPLAMQMSVCHRHPVIVLYLCPRLFRRKSSGGRLVSCSLTAHWLHRPGRLLEARVMKADIVSCLGAEAHGYVLRPRQGVGLRGIPFPQSRASDFGPSLLYPASEPVFHPDGRISRPRPSVLHPVSRACPSSRWPHFTALSIGSPSHPVACPSFRWPQFMASSIGSLSHLVACPSSRWPQFTALSGEPSFALCGIPPFSPSFYPK